jgi:hypothetical protein
MLTPHVRLAARSQVGHVRREARYQVAAARGRYSGLWKVRDMQELRCAAHAEQQERERERLRVPGSDTSIALTRRWGVVGRAGAGTLRPPLQRQW